MDIYSFIERHIQINDGTHYGSSYLKLNEQQRIVLNNILLFDKLGIVQDRQLGYTTLISGYISHWLLYNTDEKNEIIVMDSTERSTILDKIWRSLNESHKMFKAEGKYGIRCGNNVVNFELRLDSRLNKKTFAVIVDNANYFKNDVIYSIFKRINMINKLIICGDYERSEFMHDYMYNEKYVDIFKLKMVKPDSTIPDFPIYRESEPEIVNFNITIPSSLMERIQGKLDSKDLTLAEYLETLFV